jgi:hypothetical protein
MRVQGTSVVSRHLAAGLLIAVAIGGAHMQWPIGLSFLLEVNPRFLRVYIWLNTLAIDIPTKSIYYQTVNVPFGCCCAARRLDVAIIGLSISPVKFLTIYIASYLFIKASS